MGKTKTAFVEGISEGEKKPSYDKTAKAAKRLVKEAAAAKKTAPEKKGDKVHLAGLKGGQRIKLVEVEPAVVEEVAAEEKPDKKTKKIKTRGKKYLSNKAKIDKNKLYQLSKAVKLVKETSYSKFDGSVELHLIIKKTGLSFNITLPFATGRSKKIEVADGSTIKKLAANKIDFDVLLATPEIMPKLIPFAKLLGPKGLMPNPKNGTIIKKVSDAKNYSANALNLKTEKSAPIIHTVIGKVSQKTDELTENCEAIIAGVGKTQILKAYLKATMSPSIKISL